MSRRSAASGTTPKKGRASLNTRPPKLIVVSGASPYAPSKMWQGVAWILPRSWYLVGVTGAARTERCNLSPGWASGGFRRPTRVSVQVAKRSSTGVATQARLNLGLPLQGLQHYVFKDDVSWYFGVRPRHKNGQEQEQRGIRYDPTHFLRLTVGWICSPDMLRRRNVSKPTHKHHFNLPILRFW